MPYESKAGRAYLRGCLVSLGAGAVGLILGVALVVSVLLLIRGGDVEPRSPRVALALAMPLLLVALLLAAAFVFVRLRAWRLDRAFARWGLAGRQGGATMRSWHGEIGGRAFDAWVHKGPTLELYLGCRPATRGGVHRGGALIRAVEHALGAREPLTPPPLELEGASFYADDPDWLRRLLARRDARQAVAALMTESGRAAAAVFVAPNAVRTLRKFLPLAEIRAANLERWVGALEELAAAVDELGPSSDGLEPTRMEEWARTARDRYLNRILLGLGLLMLLILGALFLFGYLNVGRP